MTQITFVESNGTRHEVDASNQQSLMQVALSNLIPGILADCGGVCSCATCHVLIDAPWSEQLPAMSETETFLVDGIPDQEPGRSRLSCQIRIKEDMQGMVVHLPEEQY